MVFGHYAGVYFLSFGAGGGMALRRGVKICYNSRDLVWLAELVGGRDVCSLVAYGNNVSVNNLLCPKR